MISTYFDCEGDETSLTQCEVVHDHSGCDTGQATVSCHAPDGKKLKKLQMKYIYLCILSRDTNFQAFQYVQA